MTRKEPFYRKSLRLPEYDYSQPGGYFVTLLVRNKERALGQIENDVINLSAYGMIVDSAWNWLGNQYPYVELDAYCIMPNHMHGIIIISSCEDENSYRMGASRCAHTIKHIKPLGQLIGAFKTTSTKKINALRSTPGARFWHRNFYDHVIRDDKDLERIREYILGNPYNLEN